LFALIGLLVRSGFRLIETWANVGGGGVVVDVVDDEVEVVMELMVVVDDVDEELVEVELVEVELVEVELVEVELVEVELVEVELVEVELVEVLVVDVVEEVELEGSSASPISTQGLAVEDKVKGKSVGEDTPLVAYSALPPNVPPLDPGDKVKPLPAAVETRLGSPTMPTRKAPL
jgi:hypothetical protein